MSTIDTHASTAPPLTTPHQDDTIRAEKTDASPEVPTQAVASSTVSLSPTGVAMSRRKQDADAYDFMLNRVFHITTGGHEPPVAKVAYLHTWDIECLTLDDRRFLARAFQASGQHGVEPEEIDELANAMASFRFYQVAGNHIEIKPGERWSTDGSPNYYKMTDADTEKAIRILNSQSAATTSLDQGFIAYTLNPRGRGWTNSEGVGPIVSFDTLEKVINWSGTGVGQKADPDTLDYRYKNSLYRISKQDEPDLPPEGWMKWEASAMDILGEIHAHAKADPDREFLRRVLELLERRVREYWLSRDDKNMLGEMARNRSQDTSPETVLQDFLEIRPAQTLVEPVEPAPQLL